ncbi:MAG: hypothetical protein NVV68_13690 [Dokdonella sp.]|nr:hypothetical protein [Dokdonella sp.]
MSVSPFFARPRASAAGRHRCAAAGWRLLPALCGLLAAVLAGPATAAVLTVGAPGTGCNHTSVQAAVNAAQATPGADTIRISRSQSWTAQQIGIDSPQDIELIGGFATCGAAAPDGVKTVLDGTGGDRRPVLTIRGNGVFRLRNLTITGGDQDGDDNGGGIYYEGGGILDIADSAITNNVAYDGGGIYAVGTSILAELVLGANVTVGYNTARKSGGGVVAKSIEMSLLGPASSLMFNVAQGSDGGGNGGGLVVVSEQFPSYAYISSNGIGGIGAIYGNTAVNGGGIAVLGGIESASLAEVRIFSTESANPVRINANTATARGGGIYLKPDADLTSGDALVYARLWHTAIADNTAPDGAAVFLDYDSQPAPGNPDQGANFYFNSRGESWNPVDPPPSAAACALGRPCGYITGNHTGNPTGAVIRARGAVFTASRVAIHDNEAGRLFHATDERAFVRLANSLLADNVVAEELVRLNAEDSLSHLAMGHVTIAGNAIGAASVLVVEDEFHFDRSLVAQPGKRTLAAGGGARNIEYVLTNDNANMPGAFALSAPRFVDPARGDYHLRAGSMAVDFAPAAGGVDLEGRSHDIDMPIGGTLNRTADAGAYERPAVQPLVLNGDFDMNLDLWEATGVSSWDGTQNASGPAGSGSVQSAVGSDDLLVAARAQCIHLPGPGNYYLNGWGRVTAGSPFANTVRLRWELRHNDAPTSCRQGAPNAQGVHTLAQGATWRRPTAPAAIVVPAASWSRDTSLTVYLEVVNGNPIKGLGEGEVPNGGPTGWFDGITLGLDGEDRIFADDFEN